MRVASVAERLLLKRDGCAPGCGGLVLPVPLGGCRLLPVDHVNWRGCLVVGPPRMLRWWPLALACLSASDFGEAGLSESGAAFLLVGVPVPALPACLVYLCPVCASALAVAAAASSTVWRIRGSSQSAAAAAALAAVRRAAARAAAQVFRVSDRVVSQLGERAV